MFREIIERSLWRVAATITLVATPLASVSGQTVLASNTVFVDVAAGSDPNGERGHINKPFQTIAKAFAEAEPGDTIEIRPGLYETPDSGGDAVNRYKIAVADKENLTIRGVGVRLRSSAPNAGILLQFTNCPGLTILGIELDGRRESGTFVNNGMVEITSSADVRIENLRAHDSRLTALRFIGACPRASVRENRIWNCYNGIVFTFGDADQAAGSISFSEVSDNTISDSYSREPGTKGIGFTSSASGLNTQVEGLKVLRNNVVGCGEMGIELWAGTEATRSFRGCEIAGNYSGYSATRGWGNSFGISVANVSSSDIHHNRIRSGSYIGLEVAGNSHYNLVNANVIDGTIGDPPENSLAIFANRVGIGFASTNVRCKGNQITENIIRGCSMAFQFQDNLDTTVRGNKVSQHAGDPSTNVVAYIQNCSGMRILDNQFTVTGPGVLDFLTVLSSYLGLAPYEGGELIGNSFSGHASRSLALYANGSASFSNLRIGRNDARSATVSSGTLVILADSVGVSPGISASDNLGTMGGVQWPAGQGAPQGIVSVKSESFVSADGSPGVTANAPAKSALVIKNGIVTSVVSPP